MTCAQLGGPCDLSHEGETADEIIKNHDKHLKAMVASGDTAHEPARAEMRGRWKRPVAGMRWYKKIKAQFTSLPEE